MDSMLATSLPNEPASRGLADNDSIVALIPGKQPVRLIRDPRADGHPPADASDGQVPRVIREICAREGVAAGKEPTPELRDGTGLCCGLL
jgi:hypothetical protein